MQTILGFALAMSITMVLIPLLMRWAVPLRIVDMPGARKVHAGPVPRVGGIAMVLGVLAALLLGGLGGYPMQTLMVGMVVLLCFGVWDDRASLSAAPKFLGQLVAALIVMVGGSVSISALTWAERLPVPVWLAWPLTLLFVLGGTNAFNLADGLDGLAGGMAMLCLCGTALLAFTVGNALVGGAAVVMVGALIGFLRFNTHPARVFMGDGGSQVLGLFVAVLALLLTQDSHSLLSTALPLLLLGMPIIDTLMVMTERLLHRQSPFKADRGHIHHRLLALGFEHGQAVSILYLLQACLLVAAWYLRYEEDLTVGSVFVAFAVMVLVPLRVAQHYGVRLRRAGADRHVLAPVQPAARQWPCRLATTGLVAATAAFAVFTVLFAAPPSRELRALAWGLIAVLIASLAWRWKRTAAGWVEKGALYSCAALAIFLGKRHLPGPFDPRFVEYTLFAILAVAIAVWMHASRDRAFRLTSLDILVLLLVVTIPNLPGSVASVRSVGLAAGELMLLFYALETLCFGAGPRWRWLSGAGVVFLVAVVLRAA